MLLLCSCALTRYTNEEKLPPETHEITTSTNSSEKPSIPENTEEIVSPTKTEEPDLPPIIIEMQNEYSIYRDETEEDDDRRDAYIRFLSKAEEYLASTMDLSLLREFIPAECHNSNEILTVQIVTFIADRMLFGSLESHWTLLQVQTKDELFVYPVFRSSHEVPNIIGLHSIAGKTIISLAGYSTAYNPRPVFLSFYSFSDRTLYPFTKIVDESEEHNEFNINIGIDENKNEIIVESIIQLYIDLPEVNDHAIIYRLSNHEDEVDIMLFLVVDYDSIVIRG